MSRIHKAVLAVLLLASCLLAYDYVSSRQSRSFDYEGFVSSLSTIYPDQNLVLDRFEEDVQLLPEEYIYFEAKDSTLDLISIYLGYYPFQGHSESMPHDPRVCYPNAGYDVTAGPDLVTFARDEGEGELHANRIVVEWRTDKRLVFYWRQERGELPLQPEQNLDSLEQTWSRFQSGRSDLVWVRVEFALEAMVDPIPVDWQGRISSTMQAVAAAML